MTKTFYKITGYIILLMTLLWAFSLVILYTSPETFNIYSLTKYDQGCTMLNLSYYLLLLVMMLLFIVNELLHKVLSPIDSIGRSVSRSCAVIAVVFKLMGAMFIIISIKNIPEIVSSDHSFDLYNLLYNFIVYGLGESLAWLFLGIWGIIISIIMFRTYYFKSWVSWWGIIASIVMSYKVIGIFDIPGLKALDIIGFSLFLSWLAIIAFHLMFSSKVIVKSY